MCLWVGVCVHAWCVCSCVVCVWTEVCPLSCNFRGDERSIEIQGEVKVQL